MDPCTDDYVEAYLNRPQVQKALHANLTNIPYAWQLCRYALDRTSSSQGTYGEWAPNLVVQNTIKDMKLPIKSSWRAWYVGGEVGGYTQVYEGELTFATIRGAGHEVPSYQPARALSLISSFLAGIQLPYSSTD
ncbi:hypothetical protein SASPL_101831 [Salvia splendens]|uniref:Uncharacterized protein n=1 Tax=Salvia splendens TaxID=180675 RepID=A0A8X8YVK6_SALSN|nr:hypothetical protein SASPL_101831 [Salvia splendens]